MISVIRVAVMPEQVLEHGLDTAPAKATDNRSFEGIDGDPTATAQAEALPPDLLALELQSWIDHLMDADICGFDAPAKLARSTLTAIRMLRPFVQLRGHWAC